MSSNRVFMPVAGRLVIPSPDEPAGIDVVGDGGSGSENKHSVSVTPRISNVINTRPRHALTTRV
jgi:hypothetical protein